MSKLSLGVGKAAANGVTSALSLDGIAEQIHRAWAETKSHQVTALEGYLATGHLLGEARSRFRADRDYGRWFTAQAFGFSTEWARRLRQLAEREAEVRASVASALATGQPPPGPEALWSGLRVVDHEARREAVLADITAEPQPLPSGPFRVIVADPPWRYQSSYDPASRRVANPYPDMALEDIIALGTEVRAVAHDDAVLWLWTTNAYLEHAFGVCRAWGFEPKTVLTWAKDRMGVGYWLRGQTEHCLMAVRGQPATVLTNQTTLLHGPLREHSRKPDEFYVLVEALCPGSRLEMFAREQRAGWTAWGAEAPAA